MRATTDSRLLPHSGTTLGLFFGAFPGGRIADFRGRKRALLAAMLTFGVFRLATVWAPGYTAIAGLIGLASASGGNWRPVFYIGGIAPHHRLSGTRTGTGAAVLLLLVPCISELIDQEVPQHV